MVATTTGHLLYLILFRNALCGDEYCLCVPVGAVQNIPMLVPRSAAFSNTLSDSFLSVMTDIVFFLSFCVFGSVDVNVSVAEIL